eukprot:CAMPEP_0195643844 /NCGR_PEP_ID=MMETSP0815-20121206/28056_1 /TAXON_ID=97485 /ORGANISM="Prymnesium parvum, Strain Texoma1" /LENGTH=54 /DNA_ID=CAMNT_0040786921 /DNA_START=379 /DNA_END=543 /DNA_ORIENTATION=+
MSSLVKSTVKLRASFSERAGLAALPSVPFAPSSSSSPRLAFFVGLAAAARERST